MIIPTDVQVMAVFAERAGRYHPLSLDEIATFIAEDAGVAAWDFPSRAVSRAPLRALCDALAKAGKLDARSGGAWKRAGCAWYGLRPNVSYWTTPAIAVELQQAAAEEIERRRMEKARQIALMLLASRHKSEYEQLTADAKRRIDRQAADRTRANARVRELRGRRPL